MNKRVACLQEEKLREIAQQPNTIVMQPTYDTHFAPWEFDDLAAVLRELQAYVIQRGKSVPVDEIRSGAVTSSTKFKRLSETCKVIFARVTEYDVASSTKKMAVIFAMIDIRREIQMGGIDEDTAKAKLSSMAIDALHTRAAPPSKSS